MKKENGSQERARYAQMTSDEHQDVFKHVVIAHPHLITVDHALHEVLREMGSALIIFICGPSGVGKTTLKDRVMHMERAAILSLSAKPPLSGVFDWKDYLKRGILALEPFGFDRKVVLDSGEEESMQSVQAARSGAGHRHLNWVKVCDQRLSLETAIMQRQEVIIDDAQYLGKVSCARQLRNQLDSIKSLAKVAETVHVLIGTYELLPLLNVSAHATVRSFFIHFSRYCDIDADLSQFKGVLSAFQDLLPFEEPTDILLEHWEFCYEQLLGCIELLHIMLIRAVHTALSADETRVSQHYLERYAISSVESYAMLHETYDFETELAYTSSSVVLRQLLGMKPQSTFHQEISRTHPRARYREKEREPLHV